jgi:hypothetical protein
MERELSPQDLARSVERLLEWVRQSRQDEEEDGPPARKAPRIIRRLGEFLGSGLESCAIVTTGFSRRDLPNLQRAVDEWLAANAVTFETIGYVLDHEYGDTGIATMMARDGYSAVRQGPARYRSVEVGEETVECLSRGVYLVATKETRFVILVSWHDDYGDRRIIVELMALDREAAQAVSAELRRLVEERNVYRGLVISLDGDEGDELRVHNLEPVAREELIFPEALLETIERNTVGYATHAEVLRSAHQHVKRGLLFHGPPGVGKSFALRYLVKAMPGRTTILLAGQDLGRVRASCELARLLAPSTVVLEDVDLIAVDRERPDACGPLLFELMNQMDGLNPDLDVLFVLTTNRPETVEPALAARPGRIDQAIRFPLPDADCRRRLLELYRKGLVINADDIEEMVSRTDGGSPAFIKELVRRSAAFAAERQGTGGAEAQLTVAREDMEAALHEIIGVGGDLTARLLGGGPKSVGFLRS